MISHLLLGKKNVMFGDETLEIRKAITSGYEYRAEDAGVELPRVVKSLPSSVRPADKADNDALGRLSRIELTVDFQ